MTEVHLSDEEGKLGGAEIASKLLKLKKTPKIASDAWPDEEAKRNRMKAAVHKLIINNMDRINLKKIYFRRLNEQDLKET
jgi:hypothetical protein